MNRRDIAIVGMACVFPGIANLTKFWNYLVNGVDPLIDREQKKHQECWGTIPRPHGNSDNEKFLVREVIENALRDTNSSLAVNIRQPTALIIGGSRDGLASLIAEELGLHGFCKDFDTTSSGSLQCLAEGIHGLREGQYDTAIIAALYLSDTYTIGQEFGVLSASCIPRPFDTGADGLVPAEGAAAVVLKRCSEAENVGDHVYAFIRGISATDAGQEQVAVLRQAYADTEVTPETINFLEASGTGDPEGDTAELETIKAVFGPRLQNQALLPFGSVKGMIGHTMATAGLASLIKTALCLSNKIIPPTLHCERPLPAVDTIPFYLNNQTRPWIHDRSLAPRRAAVNSCCPDGRIGHVVLEEVPEQDSMAQGIKTALEWETELVVLSGESVADLAYKVRCLEMFLQGQGDSVTLADVAYTQSLQFVSRHSHRLAIVCKDLDQLQEYLHICAARLASGAATFHDISVIYFTSKAALRAGKIACVFPGQGFPGLLGPYADHLFDLCLRFPEVRRVFDFVDRRDGLPEDPEPTNHLFFPPSAFPEHDRRRLQQRLASPRYEDTNKITIPAERNLSSFGVAVANWASWRLLQELGVPVDMVFGQSHGELSALCAAGVLEFPKVVLGHCQLDFAPEKYISGGGRLALVSASEEHLAPFLKSFPDVNISVHISPNFQILGGEGSQLEDLIAEVRKSGTWIQFLPYPPIHTPHFTFVRPAMEPHLKSLVINPFQVPVYSGMTGDVYPEDPDMARQTMIANLDHPVLLWQTTRKMYQDGARIFIQAGGGATMYAQAKTNIGAEDVVAVSLDVDYRSAISQLNHLCGTLLTNGVIINLAHLYEHRDVKRLDIDLSEPEAGRFEDVAVETGFTAPISYIPEQGRESIGPTQDRTTLLEEARMPFIGTILHYIENQEIVVERVLDLKEDLFLADHLFINAEGIKPISACLPVLPMTVSMELMAEVAACLVPGCGLIGFEDIKASRWIDLEDTDTLPLQASAKVHHYDEVTGTYRIAVGVYIMKEDTLAIQAMVVFGRRYQVNVELEFSELENPRPYPLTAKQIYKERRLFHGPMFQCITGETVLAERAVVGELAVLPKDGMFHSYRRPELLTDPILLDGVGQLIGLWAIDKGVYVFPIAIRRVELYCPTPVKGTGVPVHIEITQYGSKFLYADVEIQDGAGHVWMRVQAWGDWVFNWPKKVYDFRREPTRYCTSHDFVLTGLSGGAVAQYITKTDLRDLELHAMARFYLHMDEMPTFWKLSKVPERQLQWLLGRIAAKDAVRRWLCSDTDTEMLHPATFMVESDEKRQPVVKNIPGSKAIPRLSIAHSEDRAVAFVHRQAVGIDIERIKDRDMHFLETISTPRERELLEEFLGREGNAWITRLWCAKEAAEKLMGTGDTVPQGFEVTDINASGALRVFHHRSGRSVLVKTKKESDFIIAYTAEALALS